MVAAHGRRATAAPRTLTPIDGRRMVAVPTSTETEIRLGLATAAPQAADAKIQCTPTIPPATDGIGYRISQLTRITVTPCRTIGIIPIILQI